MISEGIAYSLDDEWHLLRGAQSAQAGSDRKECLSSYNQRAAQLGPIAWRRSCWAELGRKRSIREDAHTTKSEG